MGGIGWLGDYLDGPSKAERDKLIAYLKTEGRRVRAETAFACAVRDALEEAESLADYKANRLAALKRVKIELDFHLYLVQTGCRD